MSSSDDRLMNTHNQWALFRANKKHGTLVVKKKLQKLKIDRDREKERKIEIKNYVKKKKKKKKKRVLKNLITSSYRISKRRQK